MSAVLESLRIEVIARARHRCEYCLLPQLGQVGKFPIDHILPRILGGLTLLENLAMACIHCNAHKWRHVDGEDPETGLISPLFHPRLDQWSEHFVWAPYDSSMLLGLTPSGRATILRLQMNALEMVATRKLLIQLSLFPETVGNQ